MNLLLILLGCLILGAIVIGGMVLLILASRRGEGVANARREWIEGTDYQDDP